MAPRVELPSAAPTEPLRPGRVAPDQPMKVGIVVSGKFHAFHLARELHSRGFLDRVITGYPHFRLKDSGVPAAKIVALPAMQMILHACSRARIRVPDALLWSLLRGFDQRAASRLGHPDFVVIWPQCCAASVKAAKRAGARVILESGSSHITHRMRLLAEEFRRFAWAPEDMGQREIRDTELAYEAADYIAVPGAFVERSFLEMGVPASKLVRVPYGVDLVQFAPLPREDEKFRVIFCGGLSLTKGLQYLLPAFRSLDLPDSELWLIGRVTPEIRSVLAEHAHGTIKLLGAVPKDRLPWFYSQGDLLCLPSVQDGWGMVAAEAMACGLPVVCSENSAGGDLVREGEDGFVVPIRDIEALRDKISYFHKHRDQARRMGRNAMARVKEFTSDDYGRRTVESYQRILAGSYQNAA